jgi:16S rRNA (guanine966-N2)-methyltransferase
MRILSGLYKGRVLLSPPESAETRPITGLAKKSLFDSLSPYLVQANIIDLFCGTGTMGIEALSRGASRCYFAELDRQVIERLKQNLQDVGATDKSVIWEGDILARLGVWLSEVTEPVDFAFVDPPYALARQWSWDEAAANLFIPLSAKLVDGGVVVMRVPTDVQVPQPLGPLSVFRSKSYGDMGIMLLRESKKEG